MVEKALNYFVYILQIHEKVVYDEMWEKDGYGLFLFEEERFFL